jgi:hypothetical protein
MKHKSSMFIADADADAELEVLVSLQMICGWEGRHRCRRLQLGRAGLTLLLESCSDDLSRWSAAAPLPCWGGAGSLSPGWSCLLLAAGGVPRRLSLVGVARALSLPGGLACFSLPVECRGASPLLGWRGLSLSRVVVHPQRYPTDLAMYACRSHPSMTSVSPLRPVGLHSQETNLHTRLHTERTQNHPDKHNLVTAYKQEQLRHKNRLQSWCHIYHVDIFTTH